MILPDMPYGMHYCKQDTQHVIRPAVHATTVIIHNHMGIQHINHVYTELEAKCKQQQLKVRRMRPTFPQGKPAEKPQLEGKTCYQ